MNWSKSRQIILKLDIQLLLLCAFLALSIWFYFSFHFFVYFFIWSFGTLIAYFIAQYVYKKEHLSNLLLVFIYAFYLVVFFFETRLIEVFYVALLPCLIIAKRTNWKFVLLFFVTCVVLLFSLPFLSQLFLGYPVEIFQIKVYVFLAIFSLLTVFIIFVVMRDDLYIEEYAAERQILMSEKVAIERNLTFVKELGSGNIEATQEVNENDEFAAALGQVQDLLRQASQREAEEYFVNNGLEEINTILHHYGDDLHELCEHLIAKIIAYLDINQGSIFLMEKDSEGKPCLELKSTWAFDRKKFVERRLEIGQGMVGQAVLEKKSIYLRDVPSDYLSIRSGLGEANPSAIYISLLITNNEVIGAMELASFNDFDEKSKQFIEKIGENCAATISATRKNELAQKLLEKSNEITKELKVKEEEARRNLEKVEAAQKQMELAQQELVAKEANLQALINNTDDSIITLDTNYIVTILNDVVRNRYKGSQYEGMDTGVNALDYLGSVREEWKEYYDRALAGEKINFTISSSVKGEHTYRDYYINPIKNINKEIIGISVFSRDVTEKHVALLENKNKSFILSSLVNSTTDTYFAIDREFRVTFVNNVLKERFAKSGLDLVEGNSIFDMLPEDARQVWKERYEQALNGEYFTIPQERKVGDKTLFIEGFYGPIHNEEEEVIGAYVISKDITHEKAALDKIAQLMGDVAELRKRLDAYEGDDE